MEAIHLVAVERTGASLDIALLDALAAGLARVFGVSCHVRLEAAAADFAFDAVRNQYYSTALLEALARSVPDGSIRLLGVTELDLFVPVLTFVFGEAQLEGRCALVSLHRLREDFYGLPPNPARLQERLLKEAVHELGHTFGLRHCRDWRCVMASAHGIERMDVKEAAFCPACRALIPPLRPGL